MSTIVVDGVTLYETPDPRIRVGNYGGPANWRTAARGEGGDDPPWQVTGPPHQTKTQALAAVSDVALYYFGTAADLDAYAQSTMGQLELTQRANIELRERIEAALAIADEAGSYRKVQRMAAVLDPGRHS